jgi:outer membrane protein insertion porin family
MRNLFALISLTAAVSTVLGVLYFSQKDVMSITSRFEGKVVRRIEYKGIKKLQDGKEEIVELKFIDGESLVRNEIQQRTVEGDTTSASTLIAEGEPLRSEAVKETIKLFFKGGKVIDVRAEAQDFGDGVLVRFLCEERPLVSKIEFKGLDKVMEADLKDKLLIKEGEPFRRDLLDKSLPAIKRKYDETGLFNCILDYTVTPDSDRKDGSLRVLIKIDEGEDIKIASFSILGTYQIKDYELRGIIETKAKGMLSDGVFKRDLYEQDKQRILAYYKKNGYIDAEIINDPNQLEYEWADPENNEGHVREIYITLKVKEGERYYFDGYEIKGVTGTVGNKEDNDMITLDRVKQTTQLRKLSPDEPGAVKTFLGIPIAVTSDEDTVLDYVQLEKDRYEVGMLYAHFGHLNARVTPTYSDRYIERTEDGVTRKIKLRKYNFDIFEGTKSYIEKIYIRGNKKTEDKVIRREVLMKEESNGVAEPFDSYKMNMTRERIYNLGFFKEVNIDIRPGSAEDKVNLIIDVQEQPTGTISVGGSWASQSGFAIFADLGEKNLMGKGWAVNLRLTYGPTQMSGTIGFTEPWLFDKPVAWNVSLTYSRLQKTDSNSIFSSGDDALYIKQSAGYATGLSYRFLYYFNTGISWSQLWTKLTEASGNCSDDIFIEKSLGIQDKRTLSGHITYDSRNNYLNPTRGAKVELEAGMTGGYFIRGDYHFISYTPSVELYFSPMKLPNLPSHPIVIQLRGSGNFITPPFMRDKVAKMQNQTTNPWVKTEDVLYLGGPGFPGSGLMRGWDLSDTDYPESWQDGLYHQLLYGAELRIPFHPEYLWGTLFFDAGSLWTDSFWEKSVSESKKTDIDNDKASGKLHDIRDFNKVGLMSYFRYSYGFGFKIQIPMMPLRFYFGRKLLWNGVDNGFFKPISGFNFQFTIGDFIF